ncbi:GIP, partial [Symbiodinium microadriaticum]
MSAQPVDHVLLREEGQSLRCGASGAVEEETGAGGSGATQGAASEPPQMNGVGSGGSEQRLRRSPDRVLEPAETAVAEEQPRGSNQAESYVADDVQGTQTRTDNGPQGATSGVDPAVMSSAERRMPFAVSGEDVPQPVFMTPRSRRSATSVIGEPIQGNGGWPGWMVKLGDLFKVLMVLEYMLMIKVVIGEVTVSVFEITIGVTEDSTQQSGAQERPQPQDNRQGSEGAATTAILEALTKNLVSLQEMQLKSMKKDIEGEDSPEQVKSSAIALPMLLGPNEPSSGIVFQDWITQVDESQFEGVLFGSTGYTRATNRVVHQRGGATVAEVMAALAAALQDVVKYQQHLQAEVEALMSARLRDVVAVPSALTLMIGLPNKGTQVSNQVQHIEPEGESSPSASATVINGEPMWTLESLIQAAAKVAGATGQAPKAPSINVFAIRHRCGVEPGVMSYALVDSGATHALRRAADQEEWDAATPVVVNLAGGESVGLRMNEAGTILVQPTSLTSASSTAPIVPLGALVSQLGYTMVWGKNKCKLEGPSGESINLKVREGCPEITEHQALELISRIEDRRLEQLRVNTSDTRTRVKAAAMAMNRTWFDHLLAYVNSDFSSEGFKAVEAAPFLDGVPRPCLAGIFEAVPESNGWDILRGLKHLNRKTRKKLWSSDSWIVHLFAGDRPKKDMYHMENHGHVVLELDIARGRTQNILDPAVWRVLEWAARKGKIAGIVGGPPQGSFMISRHIVGGPDPLRSNEYPYGNWDGQSAADVYEVNRHTTLYVRMIMLHAIATAGKIRHPGDPSTTREVAFMLEQPRDPRGYLGFQDPLYNDVVSFWRTPLWMEYALEAGLHTHSFDLAAFGKSFARLTTVGTNLPMQHLNGLRARFHTDGPIPEKSPPRVWPTEFYEHLLIALVKWFQVPRMLRMSAAQWKEHVQRGHLPFRPDCAVCVQAGATGRRHSRVEHPTAFVLSADLSGPVKVGGVDPDGRGAFPKQFKYIFAAKLRVPRSFVEDGRGVWMAYDPGELSVEDYEAVEDGLAPDESHKMPDRGSDGDRGADAEEGEFAEGRKRDPEEDSDLAGPELVNLIFACGLKDDKATTVLEAVQDVVLYCRSLNIPILRFHSDRGMEFRARATRQWLKTEGIRVTSSEPGVHQTNGTAESTIRWLKQRARTLLLAAGLPQHLWPSAMSSAASMQRGDVLGFEPKFAAPYGAKVMVRKRHMEGPKQEDLAPKWVAGVYVGLSDSVSKGHLVYVKDDDGERFIHTLHVRAGLHDPGPVTDEYIAEHPEPPDRRLRGKSAGSGDVVGLSKTQVVDELEWKRRADELLRTWSQEEAEALVLEIARNLPQEETKYGMFRHGGKLGVTKATVERPWFARLLNRFFKEKVPDAEYAAVFVSNNNEREVHIDRNNAVGMVNHVLPISMPRRGGELWMELRDGDVVSGKVVELASREGRTRYGCAYTLQEGRVFSFDPHRRHAVLPWAGERIAIIGYTPGLFGSLQRADREVLRDLQFPLPLEDEDEGAPGISIRALSAAPVVKNKEFEEEHVPLRGGGWSEVIPTSDGDYLFKCDWSVSRRERGVEVGTSTSTTSTNQSQEPVDQEEWDDWEMKLILNDDSPSSSMATIVQGRESRIEINKAEVAYTLGIEKLLDSLSAPLSIVHTVHPGEAANCLERWIPAISKEAGSLEHAVDKVLDTDVEVIRDIQSGGAEVIPMKLVFTVKPPDADIQDFYKRKARIVICGNLASHCPEDVFASTAPAEVVRAAIALATYFNWDLGMIDIVAAFLQTPLHAVKNAPKVYGKPPKLLIRSGICKAGELWKLTHAVYGLQESPRLWGSYRDEQLSKLVVTANDRKYVLVQGKVEASWWRVVDQETGELAGIIVVYVDDILLSGSAAIVCAVAEAIRKLWRTSPLQIVAEKEVRFLGIEIAKSRGGYSLSQRAYIDELLRLHETPERRRDLIPVSKDAASFAIGEDEAVFGEQEVRSAQKIAGELLWISQRSRPDVAFACSLVGSLATRAPRRAIEVGEKVLAYLQRTWKRSLTYEGRASVLACFVDASFAPDSTRSHTGWIIQLGGNVIAWRSSRQTSITLSTAESELEAMTEGLKWSAWIIYDRATPGATARATEDPDKTPDYGRDLANAREYEQLFDT